MKPLTPTTKELFGLARARARGLKSGLPRSSDHPNGRKPASYLTFFFFHKGKTWKNVEEIGRTSAEVLPRSSDPEGVKPSETRASIGLEERKRSEVGFLPPPALTV